MPNSIRSALRSAFRPQAAAPRPAAPPPPAPEFDLPPVEGAPAPDSALATLYALLNDRDYDALFTPAGEESPIDQLHIALGQWHEWLLPMKMVSLRQVRIADGLPAQADPDEPAAELLHGSLVMPFHISPSHMHAFKKTVLHLNRALPLCSFGVCGEEGSCFLQTCIVVEPYTDFPATSAEEHIAMSAYAAQTFAPILAEIAHGRHGFSYCVDELEKMGIVLPTVPVVKYRAYTEQDES